MENNYCLNCEEPISKKFCPNCGQKTDTHRITPKHFFFHDILHGVWHLDKGIVFTIKEAITRPGQAALDYIKGKRVKYYNVFYLCLILIGLNIFLRHIHSKNFEITVTNGGKLSDFLSKYIKAIIFLVVPILSFNSLMIFKKMKLNIAEHFIVAGYCLLLFLVSTTFFQVFSFAELFPFLNKFSIFNFYTWQLVMFLIPSYVYFTFGQKDYSISKLLVKIFLLNLLIVTEILLILLVVSKTF